MTDQQPEYARDDGADAPLPLRRGPVHKKLFSLTEAVALGLSIIWILIAVSLSHGTESNGTVFAVTLILPVAMIWIGALTFRALQDLRAESRELRATVTALRKAMIAQQHSRVGHSPARQEDRSADRRTTHTEPQNPPETEAAQLSLDDFVLALNFPDGPEDQNGIRALRTALSDPAVAKLIRSAQDVLNLMAQDNIFMDELPAGTTDPDLWRRFAAGERGGQVAVLGAASDPAALEISATRMQSDMVFRDAVHHFLRQFDKTFISFEQAASDDEVERLANTRTARAFTLLGNVTQIFG